MPKRIKKKNYVHCYSTNLKGNALFTSFSILKLKNISNPH